MICVFVLDSESSTTEIQISTEHRNGEEVEAEESRRINQNNY